ncbi:MAG: hypothetical protein ACK5TH_16555, partial [Prosthecobacter sp.]
AEIIGENDDDGRLRSESRERRAKGEEKEKKAKHRDLKRRPQPDIPAKSVSDLEMTDIHEAGLIPLMRR